MMAYDSDAYGIDASSVQVGWFRDGYTESVPKCHSDRKTGNILLFLLNILGSKLRDG